MTASEPESGAGAGAGGGPSAGDGERESRVGRLLGLVESATAKPDEADERYERIQALKGRVSVRRHGLGARVSHWVQALLMFVLVGTGYAIWTGTYGPLNVGPWDGYYVAFGLHVWAGILLAVFFFVLFPFYHVYVEGHRQIAELADVREALHIGKAFVGLESYIPGYRDAREAYDAEEGDWVAHHPMQKTFFWWISIFFGVLLLTGFGMYAELRTDPVWWVSLLGFLERYVGLVLLEQVHLLAFFVVVAMVVGHVYFALLPSNRAKLKSMVFGEMDAYVLGGEEDDAGDE